MFIFWCVDILIHQSKVLAIGHIIPCWKCNLKKTFFKTTKLRFTRNILPGDIMCIRSSDSN